VPSPNTALHTAVREAGPFSLDCCNKTYIRTSCLLYHFKTHAGAGTWLRL